MSYVTLHAQFPPGLGATEYEQCLAQNDVLRSDYEAQLAAWEPQKRAYDIYKGDLKLWQDAIKKRSSQIAQAAATYAARMASYKAKRTDWEERMRAYQKALSYNRGLDAKDAAVKAAVEQKYGIKFPADGLCLDATQKSSVQRVCEATGVKGLGYIFSVRNYPACALNELNVCRSRATAVDPGPPPAEPTPPAAAPPPPPEPPPVADPGPAPPAPKYLPCQKPAVGGIATFGLLAVLIVGGGALGYRQWKKRKKAA